MVCILGRYYHSFIDCVWLYVIWLYVLQVDLTSYKRCGLLQEAETNAVRPESVDGIGEKYIALDKENSAENMNMHDEVTFLEEKGRPDSVECSVSKQLWCPVPAPISGPEGYRQTWRNWKRVV